MSTASPAEDFFTNPPAAHEVLPLRGRRFRLLRYLIRRDPLACVLVLFLLVGALFGPLIEPHSANAVNLLAQLQGPGPHFLFGTDQFGRDLLSRILGATRVAVEACMIVLLIGGVGGTVLGTVAGIGGIVDLVISRFIEVVQGFPIILLAIVIVAITGPSLAHAMIAVGIGGIPDFARVSRSIALQLHAREFVEAARSVGASELRILSHEILPNMRGSLIVIASFNAAQAVMYEATLSFLGLGIQPPEPSFGGMLSDAKGYLDIQPWYALIVGVALAAVILGLNLLGDALSDYYGGGERT